jgi:hypothetical protein
MKRKLGRKAVKTDSRTLRLGLYLGRGLPTPPPALDWTKGITQFGVMLNDQIGCCTIAGVAHAVQVWSANASSEVTVPDSTVLSYYEQWDGYDPSDPSTDQGGIELDVLNNWKKSGFSGHSLLGYADPTVSNIVEIRQTINLFGGVYIGMNVPNFVMQDPEPGTVWDVVADDGGIDGGHAVFVAGYDASAFTFISWGQVFKMTVAFWNRYVDEAHALLSPDWLNTKGTPNGFNLQQLQQDLAAIR